MSEREKRIEFLKNILKLRIVSVNPGHRLKDLDDLGRADLTVIDALECGRKG